MVRLFIAASFWWFFGPWLIGLCAVSGEKWFGTAPWVAKAELRSIGRSIARGRADSMNALFPEGKLFSFTFYGFSLVNMATADPEDAEFRQFARSELERIVPLAEAELDSPQFSQSKNLTPAGGAILAGQTNLLRAGYVLIGGDDAAIIEAFHAASKTLHAQMMNRPVVSLETYPGMVWPVDNCCALESIRLHDAIYGTNYSEACRRWARWMAEHLDDETGIMVAQISSSGEVLDGPRGCALSWSLGFMPGFAPELARSQYERYRERWFVHVLGTTGVREWPPGQTGHVDSDTGPIVFGIGAAASGFGIGAAKANGDDESLTAMLRGLELTTLPLWNLDGKQMFGGHLLLGDAIAMWGKTVRVWDAPPSDDGPRQWPSIARGRYWLVLLIAFAFTGGLIYLASRSAVKAAGDVWRNPQRWTRMSTITFAVATAALAAWLWIPAFHWFWAVLVLGVTDIVERRVVPQRLP